MDLGKDYHTYTVLTEIEIKFSWSKHQPSRYAG